MIFYIVLCDICMYFLIHIVIRDDKMHIYGPLLTSDIC